MESNLTDSFRLLFQYQDAVWFVKYATTGAPNQHMAILSVASGCIEQLSFYANNHVCLLASKEEGGWLLVFSFLSFPDQLTSFSSGSELALTSYEDILWTKCESINQMTNIYVTALEYEKVRPIEWETGILAVSQGRGVGSIVSTSNKILIFDLEEDEEQEEEDEEQENEE